MNLGAENLDKIRVWLETLVYFYEDEAKRAISDGLQEHCLVEANDIKAFLDKNWQ